MTRVVRTVVIVDPCFPNHFTICVFNPGTGLNVLCGLAASTDTIDAATFGLYFVVAIDMRMVGFLGMFVSNLVAYVKTGRHVVMLERLLRQEADCVEKVGVRPV